MELVLVLLLAGLLGYVIGREDAVGRARSWIANRRKGAQSGDQNADQTSASEEA